MNENRVNASDALVWLAFGEHVTFSEMQERYAQQDIFWEVPDEFVWQTSAGRSIASRLYDVRKEDILHFAQLCVKHGRENAHKIWNIEHDVGYSRRFGDYSKSFKQAGLVVKS